MRVFVTSLIAAVALAIPAIADKPEKSVLSHEVKTIDGETVNLATKYKGEVLLIVNVASQCGYTKQYDGLQALNATYQAQGLKVLGFPCNQFGGQEPGDEKAIKSFCSSKHNVTFDMFSKIDVNGDKADPLYKDLTAQQTAPQGEGKIGWNFEKFLVGRDGQVIGRYKSGVTPEELKAAIEKALAAKS